MAYMQLAAVTDTRPAQWVVEGLDSTPYLSGLIPAGFTHHARILHGNGDCLEVGGMPEFVSNPLKNVLYNHTALNSVCWIGIWIGWAITFKPEIPETLSINSGYREWWLFTGSQDHVGFQFYHDFPYTANIMWPAGREWFLATEIDFDCTYIGGSAALINDLLVSEDLDVQIVNRNTNVC